MDCMACGKELESSAQFCTRCGFVQYYSPQEDTPEYVAMKLISQRHRELFLKTFEFGIYIYSWKNVNGHLELDEELHRSFGTGDYLLNQERWLDESFARFPEEKLTVDLYVKKDGEFYNRIPVTISSPKEPQLQKLGISIYDDLSLVMFLKNDVTEKCSVPIYFCE